MVAAVRGKQQRASAFERAARARAASRGAVGTRHLYQIDLDRWLSWCAAHKHDPTKPSLHAATAYRDELQAAHAPLTVRRMLAALSSMYEAAVNQEKPAASWNPFKGEALPRPPATSFAKTEAISDDDARKIIAAAEADNTAVGARDAAILRLFYETGLRRASVASMTRASLFIRNQQLVARVIVKGAKEAEVEIPEGAAAALVGWLKRSASYTCDLTYVFPGRVRGPIGRSTINKLVTRRAAEAGVEDVHPHCFRAAYITAALNAKQPLYEVQASVHHSDPNTTLRYDRGVRGTGVTSAVAEFRKKKGT